MNIVRSLKVIRCLTSIVFSKQNLHSPARVVIPNLFLDECIWSKLDKWHDKTALVCAKTNRSYTYLELYKKTKVLAGFLHKLNALDKSDTIAIILLNIPEYAIIYLAVLQAGFIVTTVNPFYKPDEISRHLLQTNTKFLFTSNEIYNTVQKSLELSNLNVPVVLLRSEKNVSLPLGTIHFDHIMQNAYDIKQNFVKNTEDTVMMAFSSGTTGLPKAIEFSNKSLVSNLYQMSTPEFEHLSEATVNDQEVVPLLVPMYHVYGLVIILLHSLFRGCKVVTVPNFTSQAFINLLEAYNPTALYVVPPICHLLLNNNHFKPRHFLQIKNILSAAASLGAKDIAVLQEKKLCQKTNILQLYGLTELCGCLTQTVHIANGKKIGGIGFLLPETEGKIISIDNGKELGPNQPGELLLRGPQMFKGYYKNHKANKEAFTVDRWFKSGDFGYYDNDEHFFITDRIKNYIKVSGFQVSPFELEEIIRHHPDVEDTAVIGVPHKKLGEAPRAFVVLKRNSTLTSLAVQEYVKNKVVYYKQLKGGVSFVDSIPKSLTGKILKNELKLL